MILSIYITKRGNKNERENQRGIVCRASESQEEY